MADDHGIELFRLVALRSPRPSAGSAGQIELGRRTVEKEQPATHVARSRPDGHERPKFKLAEGTVLTSLTQPAANEVVPLGLLEEKLGAARDELTPAAIGKLVEGATGQTIPDLVALQTFGKLRDRVHGSLVCLVYSPQSVRGMRGAALARARVAMMRATRLLALLEALAGNHAPQDARAVADFLLTIEIVIPALLQSPGHNLARPPLIADLKVVRLGAPRYEPGSIAHIENVMGTESRGRTHRVLQQIESTEARETERTTETEHELGTNQQVAMQQESSRAVEQTFDVAAGVQVSASYGGVVTVDADARVAYHSSSSESSSASAQFANQVVERARDRVVERVHEERTTRRLFEIEETNSHSFENGTADNIVGVYRWVDSVQDAWVENYGKRMMLEFLVPEPAALIRWAADAQKTSTASPPPEPPYIPGTNPKQHLTPRAITAGNYLDIVDQVGATDVPPPPPETQDLALTFKGQADGADLYTFTDHSSLKVPKGYRATGWKAHCETWGSGSPDGEVWMASVGADNAIQQDNTHGLMKELSGALDLAADSIVPVAMLGRGLINLATSVRVRCDLTDAGRDAWKLDVYEAVMRAYRDRREQWEVAQARAQAQAFGSFERGPLDGGSATENAGVVRRELRRSVIHFLLGYPPGEGTFAGKAVEDRAIDPPDVDFDVAAAERDGISFFEQAFEWNNLTWVYYPYYWGPTDHWSRDVRLTAADPQWAGFLSAGAARVVAPVRPGFERDISFYLATGLIWSGGTAPTVGDPTYVDIAVELAESLGISTTPSARVDLPPVRLPTSLVWLQEGSELNPP